MAKKKMSASYQTREVAARQRSNLMASAARKVAKKKIIRKGIIISVAAKQSGSVTSAKRAAKYQALMA